MKVVARLRPELIRVAPPWRTFSETIAGLVATLAAAEELPSGTEGETARAIESREAEASTALLEIHASVPHARLPTLRRPVMAVATSTTGLYEAVPTVPIQIVMLVLSPAAETAAHVTLLGEIATLLRSGTLRSSLLAATDADTALGVLKARSRLAP